MGKPAAFEGWPKSLPIDYGPFRAIIDHCTDADSYYVLVDLGLGAFEYREIRLLGASSPEKWTPEGKIAKAFVEELLPYGTPVILRTEKMGQTFTRWLASVLMPDGCDLATTLVQAGFARWGSHIG